MSPFFTSSCDDNDDETEMLLLTSHLSLSLEGGSTGGHVLWPCVGGAKYSTCRRQRHLSEEERVKNSTYKEILQG